MKLYLLILVMLIAKTGNGCSCLAKGKIDDFQYDLYQVIFTGKVEQIEEKGLEKIIVFRVTTWYKIEKETSTIRIHTPQQESMCGLSAKTGETLLVYAHLTEGEIFRTDICTRTTKIPAEKESNYKEIFKTEVEFLERKKKIGIKPIPSVFKSADSVLVASHQTLRVDVKPGAANTWLQILIDGKPNYAILKETVKLDKQSIDSLSKLLTTPNNDPDINSVSCFDPHHVVYIFRGSTVSYFDLCFECRNFITTKDIKLDVYQLSEQVWTALATFFRDRQILYELPVK